MKRRMCRRCLSAFLVFVMALSVLSPMTAFATEEQLNGSESGYAGTELDGSQLQVDVESESDTETDGDSNLAAQIDSGFEYDAQADMQPDSTVQTDLETGSNLQTDMQTDQVEQTSSESIVATQTDPESAEAVQMQTAPENLESTPVSEYADFLSCLKILEEYANTYAKSNGEDATGLVINYIRTGIEKYNTDSWAILAGAENTAFVSYVAEQDETNGTNARGLRGIGELTIPNGQSVEFAHMFGALSVAYYNHYATANVDFGSWAGDIVDLMEYTKDKVSETEVDAMALEIREKYLGVDDPEAHSFGYLDIYADLDAYYIQTQLSGGTQSLSAVMESYFSATLTDTQRAVYFLTNRFAGNGTQAAVRQALYDAYDNNSAVSLLEAERDLTDEDTLRTACCYAFADYLYDLAKDELGGQESGGNDYYTVFSSTSSTLAPGVTQEINYAITADDKQIVYYVATVDVGRDDISVYANYHNNDGSEWAMSRVTDQMAAAQAKHTDPEDPDNYIENYNTILGVNADFYNMTNGQPSGALVMDGVVYNEAGSENFFGILKDGTPIIGSNAEWDTYKDQLQEAVGGSIYLVKDGEIAVAASDDYYNSRASRTCVGITADGKVVLMVLDGRQEPFSAGGSAEEIAQIMLEAGCVTAINLDGGGSTTYAAKQEGDDEVTVVNRPSDGYERSVSSSLLVVSTAETSNEFDHALLSTDTDYLTVGTSLAVTVTGVSASGNTAEVPEDAVLRISDESVAALANGVITAVANGDVTVELVVGDAVVGSKTLHVVVPNGLAFENDTMNAIYGVEVTLPLTATYNGNPVSINADDVNFTFSSDAGTMNGFAFIGNEESGVRNVTITAALAKDLSVSDTIALSLYKNGEAIFDFDHATAGDSSFAWDRDVSNATTTDEKYYHVTDPDQTMDVSYIFALDMSAIEIPEQLKPLISLLPGGDSADATAWNFLLQLAERVSVLTEVEVQFQVDPNLAFDFSEMTLVNEYFTMTSKSYDEDTHTLTVICNWIDQTQAIDPATANPICILSGIKATPKENAAWDDSGCLTVINTGAVSYDIYLRSSALYNVATSESIQETYNLYPFINPNDSSERGAHFGTTYATFEDSFTLDRSIWQGWKRSGDDLYYFVDNTPVTGIYLAPDYEDGDNEYYYRFGENGVCQGRVTGLFELDGGLYYAINGVQTTGWRVLTVDGADQYYYFDPATGKAVDGQQSIAGYYYTFTDYVLTRGDLIKTEEGYHYKWAGEWVMNSWVEIDGNKYYAGKAPYGYFVTDLHTQIYKYGSDTEMGYFLFDQETAVWQEDYSGLYTDEAGEIYLIENGSWVGGVGLVQVDGDYFYFRTSTGTAVKDRTYWITVTNDLLPSGQYTFDETGKMINPPDGGEVEEPDPPTDPEKPEIKNGIVSENGSLYYYVDGVLTGAGLIQLDGDYYYVRTSSGEVIHGRTYWVTATNGLLPSAQYTFDETGKMINPPDGGEVEEPDPPTDPEEPEIKNGIVSENGSLYYYVDGVLTGAGLIQLDGDYYYVRTSNGEVVHGRTYWVTATNGLLPSAQYTFADDGKMILE